MKVTLDVRSLGAGLLLGIGATLAMAQYAPSPAGTGGAVRLPPSAGRYQLVASDGRVWMFDTATRDLWNLRVDPKGLDLVTAVPTPVINADPGSPMVGPLLPASANGLSKPANKVFEQKN